MIADPDTATLITRDNERAAPKPPAVVHLSAGQLLAAAAVLDVRGINLALVDAFYRAAEEVRAQGTRTVSMFTPTERTP